VKINFADTEVNDFEPLPAGWYTVAVTDGEMKESGPNSKNPGSEYIHWEYTVQEGQFANRKVWDNTTLLPHALFSLKGLLAAAGFPVDGDLDFEIDDVIGKQIQVKLSQREADNGNTYNDVKGYKAVGVAVGGSNSLLPS
jgi:hypothetical protein